MTLSGTYPGPAVIVEAEFEEALDLAPDGAGVPRAALLEPLPDPVVVGYLQL